MKLRLTCFKVWVPETELGSIPPLKTEVDVRVDSDPRRVFKGEIRQIATISEYTPRNIQSLDERRHQVFAVKITIADPQDVFRAGMNAAVRLPLVP